MTNHLTLPRIKIIRFCQGSHKLTPIGCNSVIIFHTTHTTYSASIRLSNAKHKSELKKRAAISSMVLWMFMSVGLFGLVAPAMPPRPRPEAPVLKRTQ